MEPVDRDAGADDVARRRSLSTELLIQEQLADVSPRNPTSPWRISDEDFLPMPPRFTSHMKAHKEDGDFSSAVEEYFLSLSRGDSLRVPSQDGQAAVLQRLLDVDLENGLRENEEGQDRSGWLPKKLLGEGSSGSVILWEKARPHRPVC